METGNEALPEMIKKIMESPEIADILSSSGLKQPETPSADTEKPLDLSSLLPLISGAALPREEGSSSASAPSPSLPPELLKLLPQVMGALKGSPAPAASGGTPDKNRRALLTALKPYMSERRSKVIDTMLQLNSLTDIMTSLTGRNT